MERGAGEIELQLVETVRHGRVLVRRAGVSETVLVGFHGYAESAEVQMLRLQAIPGAGDWHLVSIQGPNVFYRGRSEEVVAGWMTRQDREAAIADNIRYVDRALDLALPSGGSAARTLVFLGFSQGVAMAFRAAVRGKHAASTVIAVGGDVPPELLEDPATRFPPVLLTRGARDEWYTAAKLEHDVRQLGGRGARVQPFTFDGAHEWPEAIQGVAADFIRGLSPPAA